MLSAAFGDADSQHQLFFRFTALAMGIHPGALHGLQPTGEGVEELKNYIDTCLDGKIAAFDISKISTAITQAFDATEKQYNPNIIDFLALKVTADFEPKIKDELVAVEDVQDSVEAVLIQAGYSDVAKAYILYRRQREKLRNMKSTILDYKEIVDS